MDKGISSKQSAFDLFQVEHDQTETVVLEREASESITGENGPKIIWKGFLECDGYEKTEEEFKWLSLNFKMNRLEKIN